MNHNLPLALTMGDPSGCGPQITVRAWQAFKDRKDASFYVRAPAHVFSGVEVAAIRTPAEATQVFHQALPVLESGLDVQNWVTGTPDVSSAEATIQSIRDCTHDVLSGQADGLVTNPISKSLLARFGFPHPGHTEFVAELCKSADVAPRPVMMLVGGGLRVALATIHMPLRKAIDALDERLLSDIARITWGDLKGRFGLASPRLAFTGLNPHAGEGGMIGREELDIINPTAAQLRFEGIDISDARPADTVFTEALDGRFDAVIAMTHDQGLIPVKTLDLWNGVNTTLGLPIVRTSPDHGTAYDAAAAGTARADSLIAAIQLARTLASNQTSKT
ncbi:MAG: 4-hydroxythreonine-4-phosphate dehydrogenase PdxA [Pseudomonadota bacterium]